MTNKEYKAKLMTIDTYNCYDYLSRTEEKELRSRNRLRVLSGEESYLSKETGFRATVKRDWYCGCSILTSYHFVDAHFLTGRRIFCNDFETH